MWRVVLKFRSRLLSKTKALRSDTSYEDSDSSALLRRGIVNNTVIGPYLDQDPRIVPALGLSAVNGNLIQEIREANKNDPKQFDYITPLKIPFRTAENNEFLKKFNQILKEICTTIHFPALTSENMQEMFRSLIDRIFAEGIQLAGITAEGLDWFKKYGIDYFSHILPDFLQTIPGLHLQQAHDYQTVVTFEPILQNQFTQTRLLAYASEELASADKSKVLHELRRSSTFKTQGLDSFDFPLFRAVINITVSPIFAEGVWDTIIAPTSTIKIMPIDFSPPRENERDTTGCDIIRVTTKPVLETIATLGIFSEAAYVRYGSALYYVKKNQQICESISLEAAELQEFDAQLSPSIEARTLTEEELQFIRKYNSHLQSLTDDEKIFKIRKLLNTEQRQQIAALQESFIPLFENPYNEIGGYVNSFSEDTAALFSSNLDENADTTFNQTTMQFDTLFGTTITFAAKFAKLMKTLTTEDAITSSQQAMLGELKKNLLIIIQEIIVAGYLSPLETHRLNLLTLFKTEEIAQYCPYFATPFFTTQMEKGSAPLLTVNLPKLEKALVNLKSITPPDQAQLHALLSNLHDRIAFTEMSGKSYQTDDLHHASLKNCRFSGYISSGTSLMSGDAQLADFISPTISFRQFLDTVMKKNAITDDLLIGYSRRQEVDVLREFLQKTSLSPAEIQYKNLLEIASAAYDWHCYLEQINIIQARTESLAAGNINSRSNIMTTSEAVLSFPDEETEARENVPLSYWHRYLTKEQIIDFYRQLSRNIPDVKARQALLMKINMACPEINLLFTSCINDEKWNDRFFIEETDKSAPAVTLRNYSAQIINALACYQNECFSVPLAARIFQLKNLADEVIRFALAVGLKHPYFSYIHTFQNKIVLEFNLLNKLAYLPNIDPRFPTTVIPKSPVKALTLVQKCKNWLAENKKGILTGLVVALLFGAGIGISIATFGTGAFFIALAVGVKYGVSAGGFAILSAIGGFLQAKFRQLLKRHADKILMRKAAAQGFATLPAALPSKKSLISAWSNDKDLHGQFGVTKVQAAQRILSEFIRKPKKFTKLLSTESFITTLLEDDMVRKQFLAMITAKCHPALEDLRQKAITKEQASLFARDEQMMRINHGVEYPPLPLEPGNVASRSVPVPSVPNRQTPIVNSAQITARLFDGLPGDNAQTKGTVIAEQRDSGSLPHAVRSATMDSYNSELNFMPNVFADETDSENEDANENDVHRLAAEALKRLRWMRGSAQHVPEGTTQPQVKPRRFPRMQTSRSQDESAADTPSEHTGVNTPRRTPTQI